MWRIIGASLLFPIFGILVASSWLSDPGSSPEQWLRWLLLPDNQWMVAVGLAITMACFSVCLRKITLLHILFAAILTHYTLTYVDSSQSTGGIGLLAGIVLCSAVAAIVTNDELLTLIFLTIIPAFIGLCAILPGDVAPLEYQYWGAKRLTGIWRTPNLFGILMAVSTVLLIGLALNVRQIVVTSTQKLIRWSLLGVIASLTAFGLLFSFSRGAWISAAVGCIYLLVTSGRTFVVSPKRREMIMAIGLIVVSLLVCASWLCRATERPLVRRLASITNPYDFSVANRFEAYKSGLKLVTIRPISGFGWSESIRKYDMYFPDNLSGEGSAINTNSYLRLAINIGVLPVIILLLIIALCVTPPKPKGENPARLELAAKAALLTIAVGLLFNPGLITASVAGTFWVLLGLAYPSCAIPPTTSARQP